MGRRMRRERKGKNRRKGKEEEKERDGFGKDCKERGERKGSRKIEKRGRR